MKKFLTAICVFLVFISFSTLSFADVYVKGYYRKNGTYVQPHYRSDPDGNFNNNWSTKGNVNPYSGKPGTKVTPPSNYNYIAPTPAKKYYPVNQNQPTGNVLGTSNTYPPKTTSNSSDAEGWLWGILLGGAGLWYLFRKSKNSLNSVSS